MLVCVVLFVELAWNVRKYAMQLAHSHADLHVRSQQHAALSDRHRSNLGAVQSGDDIS